MRKYYQRKLLELVDTLKEANDEIRRLSSNGNPQTFVNLLSDCQKSAIRIGEFTEQMEGEGTKTVSCLEEYCEMLYQFSVTADQPGTDNELLKRLQKQLFIIENHIRTELAQDKLEVVFLCYKAAMSDSLESIYLAAQADPKCDAYWIAIPYFDRSNDGSLETMHYEGQDFYGSQIHVTDYREYDLESRHPDMIFIMNPYDNGNIVTSIHPDFYSSRIRSFTDCLCYVPYFVTVGDVEEPFILTHGILNADYTIVQSEKVRQTYIRVLKEFEKKNKVKDKFNKWENRILALGSPKFDKVINTKREDCPLPEEWKNLIEGRKVVFFNTTIGAILRGNEEYLSKLRSVLDIFQKRDDVALWWRPHPLSEQTYASMRGDLLKEYRGIVDEYKSGGWGIYDDTPDVNRAIAWSDAYYGDWSSLVALYGTTGKQVMCSDVDSYNPELFQLDENAVYFLNFNYDKEQNGWAYSSYFNALCKLDLTDFSAKLLYRGCGTSLWHAYLYVLPVDGKVLALPYYSDQLLIYDTESGDVEYVSLESKFVNNDDYGSGYKLGWGFLSGDTAYLFGHPGGLVVEYSMSDGRVSYHMEIAEDISKLSQKSDEEVTEKHVIFLRQVSDSVMWFARAGYDTVIEYDFDTSEYRKVLTLDEIAGCENIAVIDESIWIVPKDHRGILRVNYITNEKEEYHNFPDGFQSPKDKKCFSAIYNWGNHILLLPAYGNMVLLLDKSSGEIRKHPVLPACGNGDGLIFEYDALIQSWDEKPLFFQRHDRAVYEYDLKSQKIKKRRFIMSDDDFREYVDSALTVNDFEGAKIQSRVLWDSWFSSDPIKALRILLHDGSTASSPFGRSIKSNMEALDGSCGNKIFRTLSAKLI